MNDKQKNIYRVALDRDWNLVDLYRFPRAFSQTYAFIYCLDSKLDPRDRDRINTALIEYPWKGGYSYVNIFSILRSQVPVRERPKIYSIQKSSPGWLDLLLNVDVAIQVANSVALLLLSGAGAVKAYGSIQKTLYQIRARKRREGLEDAKLSNAEIKLMMSMTTTIAKYIGFKSVTALHKHTGNPEVSLKVLLAEYRWLQRLAKFVQAGKAALPTRAHMDPVVKLVKKRKVAKSKKVTTRRS